MEQVEHKNRNTKAFLSTQLPRDLCPLVIGYLQIPFLVRTTTVQTSLCPDGDGHATVMATDINQRESQIVILDEYNRVNKHCGRTGLLIDQVQLQSEYIDLTVIDDQGWWQMADARSPSCDIVTSEGETVPEHEYDPQDERFFQYMCNPPKDLQGNDVSHLVDPWCGISAHSNGFFWATVLKKDPFSYATIPVLEIRSKQGKKIWSLELPEDEWSLSFVAIDLEFIACVWCHHLSATVLTLHSWKGNTANAVRQFKLETQVYDVKMKNRLLVTTEDAGWTSVYHIIDSIDVDTQLLEHAPFPQ